MASKNNTTPPIVVTPDTLARIADLVSKQSAAQDGKPLSKLQVLNHISAAISGPKHDWGFLKKAEGVVVAKGLDAEALLAKMPQSANIETPRSVVVGVWKHQHGEDIAVFENIADSVRHMEFIAESNWDSEIEEDVEKPENPEDVAFEYFSVMAHSDRYYTVECEIQSSPEVSNDGQTGLSEQQGAAAFEAAREGYRDVFDNSWELDGLKADMEDNLTTDDLEDILNSAAETYLKQRAGDLLTYLTENGTDAIRRNVESHIDLLMDAMNVWISQDAEKIEDPRTGKRWAPSLVEYDEANNARFPDDNVQPGPTRL